MEKEKISKIEKSRDLILHGNLWKTLILISLPVAFSNLVVAVFGLFDVWFSSHIGENEMAATNFVGPVNNLVSVIGTGLGIAATALIARDIASRNYEKGKQNLGQLIMITLVFSVLLLGIGITFAKPILESLNASGDMLDKAIIYFKIILFALPLKFFTNIFMGYLRSIGSNLKIFTVTFAQITVKLLLNMYFIFKLNMGIEGLGYATLISTGIPALIGIYDIFIKKNEMKIDKFSYFKFNKTLLLAILVFSLPIIVEQTTRSFGVLLVTGMATGISKDVLNAYGVANKINSLVFSFSTGFGMAIVAIVSQNIAVGNIKRVKESKYKGMILSLSVTVVLLVVILSNNRWIAARFTDSEDLIDLIIRAMSIYTVSVLPWAIMQVYFGVFRGIKRTNLTLIISLTRLWVFRVILLWLLLRFTNMGSDAIWYCMLISNIAAMVASILIDVFLVDYDKYKLKANMELSNTDV